MASRLISNWLGGHGDRDDSIPIYIQGQQKLFHNGRSNITGRASFYRDYVSRLAGLRPGLSYLDMYLNDPRYLERQFFPITMVVFNGSEDKPRFHMDTFVDLKTFLGRIDEDASDKLIILEDPTPNMVAELGGKLEIDPQFWADFLVGPSWFGPTGRLSIGTGEPRIPYRDDSLFEQLWPLPTAAKEQDHIAIRFFAHRESKKDSHESHLSRIYPLADNAEAGPQNCANSIGVRHNLNIWHTSRAREHRGCGSTPWVGIITMQHQSGKLPKIDRRHSYIFRDYHPLPKLSDNRKMDDFEFRGNWEGRLQHGPKFNHSLKEIFCHHLSTRLEDPDFTASALQTPPILFVDLFRLIGCFWVATLEDKNLLLSWMEMYYHQQVTTRRRQFLWASLLTPNPRSSLSEKLEADLVRLHGDIIEIGPYHRFIRETKGFCEALSKNGAKPNIYEDLTRDFAYLDEATNMLGDRVKRVRDFLHSISEDCEKERSRYRNKLILILTIWTFLNSPISLTSQIVNLQNSSNSGRVGTVTLFWRVVVFVGGSAVLLLLVLLSVTEFSNWKAREASSIQLNEAQSSE